MIDYIGETRINYNKSKIATVSDVFKKITN